MKNIWLQLLKCTYIASQAVVVFMMFAICYDVVARTFFDSPTDWSIEVTSFLVVFIGIIGSAEVLDNDSHIRMSFFEGYMSEHLHNMIFRLHNLLGVVLCANFVWFGGQAAWSAWEYGSRVSSAFGTPVFIPKTLLPVGFGLLAIQFLFRVFAGPVKK